MSLTLTLSRQRERELEGGNWKAAGKVLLPGGAFFWGYSEALHEFYYFVGDAFFFAVDCDHVIALVELDRALFWAAQVLHHVVEIFADRTGVIALRVHHQGGLRYLRELRFYYRAQVEQLHRRRQRHQRASRMHPARGRIVNVRPLRIVEVETGG